MEFSALLEMQFPAGFGAAYLVYFTRLTQCSLISVYLIALKAGFACGSIGAFFPKRMSWSALPEAISASAEETAYLVYFR